MRVALYESLSFMPAAKRATSQVNLTLPSADLQLQRLGWRTLLTPLFLTFKLIQVSQAPFPISCSYPEQ